MLIPSTITARRIRRYTSTWYIHPTTHKQDFETMDGRGRYIFQPPQVRQSIRPGGPLYLRLLQPHGRGQGGGLSSTYCEMRNLCLEAVTQKVHEDGRTVNVSVAVATRGIREAKREVFGLDVGTSQDSAFCLTFLRSLKTRSLSGVQLVTSDTRQRLNEAIATVFAGVSWQRYRTHFMTNLLSRGPTPCPALGRDKGEYCLSAALPGGGPRTADARRGHLPLPGCSPAAHRGTPLPVTRRKAGRPLLSARSCR